MNTAQAIEGVIFIRILSMNDFNKEELIEIIKLLQSQVNDLRWRMNAVCNFLTYKFKDANTEPLSLYMREEFDE